MAEIKVVVIGGGAAGASAALEIKRRVKDSKVVIIESGPYPQYSCCALPFVISKEISEFDDIIVHDQSFYKNFAKVDLRLNDVVTKIDTSHKIVVTSSDKVEYDKLVLATGSFAFVPPITGLEDIKRCKRVFLFKNMMDAKKVEEYVPRSKKAIIIGAGLVGIEVAVAMKERGIDVTVIEMLPSAINQMIDIDMAKIVIQHMQEFGIKFKFNTMVKGVFEKGDLVSVDLGDKSMECDICIVASGVRADVALAKEAGLEVGQGIRVDPYMRTSNKDIYACGDCCESLNGITGNFSLSQLGSTAVRQAKVVAANIAGSDTEFKPSFNAAITNIAGLHIASVGITTDQAKENGLDIFSARYKGSTLPEYYPGGSDIMIKLLFNKDKKLLGAQILGKEEVLGRINVLSTLLHCKGSLEDLYHIETAYTPPISPTIDPISNAAAVALRKLEKIMKKKG